MSSPPHKIQPNRAHSTPTAALIQPSEPNYQSSFSSFIQKKPNPRSQSSARISMGSFNVLPNEIVFEILTRLPAESVLHCKLVRKSWRNVIRHPSFPQQHFNHLNNNVNSSSGKLDFIFLDRIGREFHFIEYDNNKISDQMSITRMHLNFIVPFQYYEIVGSYNGLICLNVCYDHDLGIFARYDYEPTYICNPITRESLILPKLEMPYAKHKNRLSSGFGYCQSTGEYKVARISRLREYSDVVQVEIYTLGSGNGWRNLGSYEEEYFFLNTVGVFANGSLHWIEREGRIVAFDLVNERFHEISLPPILLNDDWQRSRSVEVGVLSCYLMCLHHVRERTVDVWLLKKKNGGDLDDMEEEVDYKSMDWSKEFQLVDHEPGHEPFVFIESGAVLWFNTNFLYATLVRDDYRSLSLNLLRRLGQNNSQPIPHMNTLVSLKNFSTNPLMHT